MDHELRKKSIGGSECAAACGQSRYTTPYQLWLQKTGREEREFTEEQEENLRMGHEMEPILRDRFVRKTGKRVNPVKNRFVHPKYDFMSGHVDGLLIDEDAGLEIKTANFRVSADWGKPGEPDCVPFEYELQCQHYMAITGAPLWYVAAYIGGADFRVYDIQRNDRLIASMESLLCEFWDHVQSDTPPRASTIEDVRKKWQPEPNKVVNAGQDMYEKACELAKIKQAIKKKEEEAEAIQIELCNVMGDSEFMYYGDRKVATWKAESRSIIDQKMLKDLYSDVCDVVTKKSVSRTFRLDRKL